MRKGIFAYLGSRILQSLLVLWVVATLLFLLFRLAPGNPLVAYIDSTFNAEQQEALLQQFGLNKSMPEQYLIYLGNLFQGEFGPLLLLQETGERSGGRCAAQHALPHL